MTFKQDHYDGSPAEYAFIWSDTPERDAVAGVLRSKVISGEVVLPHPVANTIERGVIVLIGTLSVGLTVVQVLSEHLLLLSRWRLGLRVVVVRIRLRHSIFPIRRHSS